MKLYDGMGPNPQVVRMFMAEKNMKLPTVTVDLASNENRGAEHLKRNPSGQVPTLELDNGKHISEVTVICEYLEEAQPNPPLIGATPDERAETRMWTRKIDLAICEPMANSLRFGEGLNFFKDRIHCEPEIAPGLRRLTQTYLKWLDGQLAGKQWIVGNRFTLADILPYCIVGFCAQNGQPIDPALKNVAGWLDRVRARPSAKA